MVREREVREAEIWPGKEISVRSRRQGIRDHFGFYGFIERELSASTD